jgi:Adenylate cyclase, class 2 (thermophilic)
MPIEYERRFRLAESAAQFRQRVGGTWVLRHVIDVTFGVAGMESMDRVGWIVRIRRSEDLTGTEGDVSIEYKAALAHATWRELSLSVNNTMAECAQFLSSVGLTSGMVIERVRATTHSAVRISVDEVRWLGTFVELEGPPELVADAAGRVGLLAEDEAGAYGDLLAELLRSNPDIDRDHRIALARLTGFDGRE